MSDGTGEIQYREEDAVAEAPPHVLMRGTSLSLQAREPPEMIWTNSPRGKSEARISDRSEMRIPARKLQVQVCLLVVPNASHPLRARAVVMILLKSTDIIRHMKSRVT